MHFGPDVPSGASLSASYSFLGLGNEGAAEKLFRHKVLALLRRRGLLSQERIDLLNSWRRSGFSVHNRGETRRHRTHRGREDRRDGVRHPGLVQIPDPRREYSNASRGKREKAAASADPSSPDEAPEDAAIPDGPHRASLRAGGPS